MLIFRRIKQWIVGSCQGIDFDFITKQTTMVEGFELDGQDLLLLTASLCSILCGDHLLLCGK